MMLNILFIGDIVGQAGMQIAETWLPSLIKQNHADLVIINAENASEGKGATEKEAGVLFNLGASVLTGGNHTFEKALSQEYLKKERRFLRPLNYPQGTYGFGFYIAETPKGKVGILNLQGRTFLPPIDCPFRAAEWAIKKIKEQTNTIFIDFHAESTAEKLALANFVKNDVSVFVGTHTHIQTADERIFDSGMAYISDVGMTGPYDSVIGMKTDAAINRFLYQTPQKYLVATDEFRLSGILAKVNPGTGKATSIERILVPEFERTRE